MLDHAFGDVVDGHGRISMQSQVVKGGDKMAQTGLSVL